MTGPTSVEDRVSRTPRGMLIDGALIESADGDMPVINPGDGSSLGVVPVAGEATVGAAVSAAERAFAGWRNTSIRERQSALLAMADYLGDDVAELGFLDAVDGGLPIAAAEGNVRFAEGYVRFLAGLAYSWGGRTIPVAGKGFDFTVRHPYGPTARIIPFNHPIMFAAWKIAGPLLVGNTVVLKLPDQTPLSGLRFARALKEIFPPGVVNVICGPGHVTGDALVRHEGIKRVAFIGSVSTGRRILSAVAERNVPVTAELGGKNAHIIAADAEIERAARCAVDGMGYSGAGQSCGAYSRVLVHESIADQVVERIVALTARLRVGDPLDRQTQIGPLIAAAPVMRALEATREAVDAGARVVAGDSRPEVEGCSGGFYMSPTILTDVASSMRIAREEFFAPVQVVMTWSELDEVVELANGTEYGLCASVHSRDVQTAMALAEALQVGSVAVNGNGAQHWMGAPFGGPKASGIGGKEDSIDELLEATYEKNIHVSYG